MDNDAADDRPLSGPELVLLRHGSLRLTAPAVQHEVNNALMVLASNLELLGRTAVEGPPRRQLDRATEAMRRLDQTVRGFLDAARREAEDPAEAVPTNVVAQALPMLRVALGARYGIDLQGPEKDTLPAVRLDRGQLDLGLLCLVRDAARRMTAGARIILRAEERPESREVALLLDLPPGAGPGEDSLRLLAGAAAAGGGRLEGQDGGLALVWPLPARSPAR
ncbi:histidine kinase dimerization/phospho-acceptor domain-containing protein [Falsiroseomonas sp.]|uniref:histidine kinase dimerization/phospho-acceptor domain-containing protein n=1 Tax=Falsiroseomonas sp. TaxID=2870721 RepID=UPI0035637CD4